MNETHLSKSIRDALACAGFWCMRVQSGMARVRGGMMRLAEPGTPDILVLAPVYGWLEVKREGAKFKPTQKPWHDKARKHGVRVAVVRSVAEALEAVRGWSGGGSK